MDPVHLVAVAVLALALGFVLGRAGGQRRGPQKPPSSDYFRGLDFLLDDQPDRAIEAFLRAVEIDSDTLTTHLAIGSLLRRRGEVDKATRVHQNLLARPGLKRDERRRVELELARDYLAAGLLGRAESLLRELAEDSEASGVQARARTDLLEVYERERDWTAAAELARRQVGAGDSAARAALAHYLCEQAREAGERDNHREARRLLQAALAQDSRCVRALLELGRVERALGRPREVLRWLRRLPGLDGRFVVEALDDLEWAHARLGTLDDFAAWLERLLEARMEVAVLRRLVAVRQARGDPGPAAEEMYRQLLRQPTLVGLAAVLEQYERDGRAPATEALRDVVRLLLRGRSVYRCENCGFEGNLLHWQCPSCKSWSTLSRLPEAELPRAS